MLLKEREIKEEDIATFKNGSKNINHSIFSFLNVCVCDFAINVIFCLCKIILVSIGIYLEK